MALSRYVSPKSGKISLLRNFLIDNFVSSRFLSTQRTIERDNTSLAKNVQLEPAIVEENIENFLSRTTNEDISTKLRSEAFQCEKSNDNLSTPNDINFKDDLYEDIKLPKVLDHCDYDISHIAPSIQPTFNFAAYANNSKIIQELTKLRVDLHKVEKQYGAMELLLKQDFSALQPHIRFLHDCGVSADDLGKFITKNPRIFSQDIDDMATRIRYLRAHKFTKEMIARIVSNNPFWLMFDTERIDTRLGYFQREFGLDGSEVRGLATKQPRLITYKYEKLRENSFAIKEEMGFNEIETKFILLDKPRVFMKSRKKLVEVFDFVHNTMKIPHNIISRKPNILTCRIERLHQRHGYLVALGKVQYDPTGLMYISPDALIGTTDADFCQNVAKTSLETYDMYLKTL